MSDFLLQDCKVKVRRSSAHLGEHRTDWQEHLFTGERVQARCFAFVRVHHGHGYHGKPIEVSLSRCLAVRYALSS